MKIRLFVLFASFSFVSSPSFAEQSNCNQLKGSELLAQGKYEQAFFNLKNCEDDPSVIGLSLGQLAVLYERGYGDFNSAVERAQKIYNLYLASAMKGNEDAVLSLVSMLENGEPFISLASQPSKASCLQKLLDSKGYTIKQIKDCMGEK